MPPLLVAPLSAHVDNDRSQPPAEEWDLRLYVAGQTENSRAAIENLRRICEEHLPGKHKIEIIDLLQNPRLASGDRIVAIPTLVRNLPGPVKRIIGDLSNVDRVLVGLQLQPRQA